MDVRKKLVDIVERASVRTLPKNTCHTNIVMLVNALIEEGVTVQEWISVKDRLPKPSTYVLALTAPGYLSVGQNCVVADYIHPSGEEHGVFVLAYRYWEDPLKVTHWMPLPEPPKGE